MKRTLITTCTCLAVLCFMAACHKVSHDGQTGKILHKAYSPALNINLVLDGEAQTWDTIRLDLDRDGMTDLRICFFYETPYITCPAGWELGVANGLSISDASWWNMDFHVDWGLVYALAVRHTTDEGICYGWLDCYSTRGSEGQVDAIRFYLRETAYCTCPDYPLQWGEK